MWRSHTQREVAAGMRMRHGILLMLGIAMLAGCVDRDHRLVFDGHYFRAKVAKVDRQRHVFTVRIRDVDQSLDGARAAGQHEGMAYCIENFGSSDITWTVGPETPAEVLQIIDNTLTFQGTCPTR